METHKGENGANKIIAALRGFSLADKYPCKTAIIRGSRKVRKNEMAIIILILAIIGAIVVIPYLLMGGAMIIGGGAMAVDRLNEIKRKKQTIEVDNKTPKTQEAQDEETQVIEKAASDLPIMLRTLPLKFWTESEGQTTAEIINDTSKALQRTEYNELTKYERQERRNEILTIGLGVVIGMLKEWAEKDKSEYEQLKEQLETKMSKEAFIKNQEAEILRETTLKILDDRILN